MSRFFKLIVVAVLLGLPYLNRAQNTASLIKINAKDAEKKLLAGNYEDALDDYLNLVTEDPHNTKYNYDIGVCYLNIHGNKTKAIPYLVKAVHDPKHDPNADYFLGRAYHYANRFDDAIKALNVFKEGAKGTVENLKMVDQQIQYCWNAKELMKFPLNVTFTNLGTNVNTEYDEHFAFIPIDESFVVFNTNRPEKSGVEMENGEFGNSIYISEVKNGEFQKAYSIGSPINKGNSGEEIIGLSANGDIMLLYIKEGTKSGNIYISEKDNKGLFKKPVLLDENVNSTSEEIAASISTDGNTIYFASNRPGGFGGTDIYVSSKTPNGKWGVPVNLGTGINTPQNEDFPNIAPDGKTLYFSSTGHTSMGGYDIFKAQRNEESTKWENARNLGYPINTTDDDMNFRISRSERYGYISAFKEKGLGDFDNYRVIFNEVDPEFTVIRGTVLSEDGTQVNYPDVLLTVTDENTKELIGTYLPNPNTGKYVIILPPGKYMLEVDLFNFRLLTKKLEILDKISFQSVLELDLKLQIKQ